MNARQHEADSGWDARLWGRWALYTAVAYLVLLAATPLSGRWMLWVTAPGATAVTEPGPSIATAAAPAHPH